MSACSQQEQALPEGSPARAPVTKKALDRISSADISVSDISCLRPIAFRMICSVCSP